MPTVFRLYCDCCDVSSETEFSDKGIAGAVLFGSDHGGKLVPGAYIAYLTDENELIALPHPLEKSRPTGIDRRLARQSLLYALRETSSNR